MSSNIFRTKYLEILDKVGKLGSVSLTTYTELIVEILDNFEQIELKLEEFSKRKEELFNTENHILWIDYRDYKFKIYLDAERNTLVGDVLLNDEIDVIGLESDSIVHLITEMERAVDNQISWRYQSELAKEIIEKNSRIKELEQEIEKIKNEEEAAQKFLDNIDKVNKKNAELHSHLPKVIASVYWWTKEPEDEFIDEEDITEKLDEELLESLGLRYGSNKLTTINQVDYVSELIESAINVEEYDYFFEYYGENL